MRIFGQRHRKALRGTGRGMRTAMLWCAALVVAGCASIGRPEGGARDETPPVYMTSNPVSGARNVNRDRVDVWFDENVQLDDAFNKVIVSPTQKQTPVVRSQGKRVYVELRDTLLPNTTYTIDFADAIKDLNEGNILDGFAIDFSTGDDLDTLRISGMVLQARNLEPAQGMTVGIHSNAVDTTLTHVPFERIARTNQYGQFTVRNLKPGEYSVYAINDLNRDNKWDRSEDVAFTSFTVSPSVEAITVTDTLRTAAGIDSLAYRQGVAYLPNDVLLTWFNEGYNPQYLRDHARPERRLVTIGMAAPSDTIPEITIAMGPLDGQNLLDHAMLQRNATNDSLVYWLRTPEALATDSLRLAIRHEFTDSTEQIVWKNDTINFFWHEPKKKKKKEDEDSVPAIELMGLSVATPQAHEIYAPLRIKSLAPFASLDSTMMRLEMMPDSVWIPARMDAPVFTDVLDAEIDFDRIPGMKYRFTVDSLAASDIYGLWNKGIVHEFTVKKPEEYANIVFRLSNADSTAVVELLDASDVPQKVAVASDGRRAVFSNITPGTYYARLYLDANGNGRWDTGNVADSIQPEEVYYYSKKLDLRANWDVEQAWDILELPLDAQKPMAIKKNKPKLKNGEKLPTDDEDVELDEWGEPIDPNSRNSRNSRNGRNGRNNNSLNGFGGFGGFGGGLRQNTGDIRR